jgi:hypothetical protein
LTTTTLATAAVELRAIAAAAPHSTSFDRILKSSLIDVARKNHRRFPQALLFEERRVGPECRFGGKLCSGLWSVN